MAGDDGVVSRIQDLQNDPVLHDQRADIVPGVQETPMYFASGVADDTGVCWEEVQIRIPVLAIRSAAETDDDALVGVIDHDEPARLALTHFEEGIGDLRRVICIVWVGREGRSFYRRQAIVEGTVRRASVASDSLERV